MSLDSRPRRGMAVAVALVAIVLIGALIAGTFFFSSQDYRVGRMSLDTDRALTAAEFGQTTALKDWTAAVWNQNLKIGDTLKRVHATGGSSTDTVTVTRIKYNMFWVVSSGRSESESRLTSFFIPEMFTRDFVSARATIWMPAIVAFDAVVAAGVNVVLSAFQ